MTMKYYLLLVVLASALVPGVALSNKRRNVDVAEKEAAALNKSQSGSTKFFKNGDVAFEAEPGHIQVRSPKTHGYKFATPVPTIDPPSYTRRVFEVTPAKNGKQHVKLVESSTHFKKGHFLQTLGRDLVRWSGEVLRDNDGRAFEVGKVQARGADGKFTGKTVYYRFYKDGARVWEPNGRAMMSKASNRPVRAGR